MIPVGLAFGTLLVLAGLAALAYGVYALARGGRGQDGGLGPIPERGVHIVAGLRMILGASVALILGGLALWSYFSA